MWAEKLHQHLIEHFPQARVNSSLASRISLFSTFFSAFAAPPVPLAQSLINFIKFEFQSWKWMRDHVMAQQPNERLWGGLITFALSGALCKIIFDSQICKLMMNTVLERNQQYRETIMDQTNTMWYCHHDGEFPFIDRALFERILQTLSDHISSQRKKQSHVLHTNYSVHVLHRLLLNEI